MNIEKLSTRYAEGSATVVANEVTVTPTDALWYGNVWGDDRFFLPSQPLVPPQRIEAVNEDGTLTLAYPWPGASATEEPYEIRYVGIIERSTAQTRKVLEQLGDVSAYYDVQVDTLEDRDAFDARPAGFRVLVSDIGDGRAAIYSKASSVEADWTDPAMFSGPIGDTPDVTVGTVTTGDPGTDADVTATPVEGGVELDFTIPAGEGFSAEGDYDGGTSYAKGDVVQQAGSSWIALQATTGNAPPTLPTTSNAYWQLLARRGTDGAGTVTAVAAGPGVSVDATDPTEPVVSLDIMDESVKTANYTLVAADYGGTFIADDTDPIEFAFEAAATLGAKWWVIVKNIGAGDLTLAPDGSETIDGLSELVLKTGQSRLVTCNGTGLRALFEGGGGGGGEAPAISANDMLLALLSSEIKANIVSGAQVIADAFANTDGVDLAESSNYSYDSGADLFSPTPPTPVTSYANAGGQGDRTASITVTWSGATISSGTAPNLVDGVDANGSTNAVDMGASLSAGARWRMDFGPGVKKYIDEMTLRTSGTGPGLNGWSVRASNNATDWDSLLVDGNSTFNWNAAVKTIALTGMNIEGYRYYEIRHAAGGSHNQPWWKEFEFKIAAGATTLGNMELVTQAYPTTEVPETLGVLIQVVENEAITVNTDLVCKVSRDGGATFTEGVLTRSATIGTEVFYADMDVDVSGQPSGTEVVVSIETVAKDIDVLGFAVADMTGAFDV